MLLNGSSLASGGTDLGGGSVEDRLELIETAIGRGNANLTPVDINNSGTLKAAFVAGALAAQTSDAGAESTEGQLSEGIAFYRATQRSTT